MNNKLFQESRQNIHDFEISIEKDFDSLAQDYK